MSDLPTIQPIGFHLGLSGEWRVTAVSANVGEFLDTDAESALGQAFTSVFSSETIHDIRNRMALLRSDESIEHLFHCPLGDDGRTFDMAVYRNGNGFGIDVEPCAERTVGNATGLLAGMMSRVTPTDDIGQLCDQASNQLRALTGFQQVVISAGAGLLGQSVRAGPAPIDIQIDCGDRDIVVFDRDAPAVPVHLFDENCVPERLTWRSPTDSEIAKLAGIGACAALVVPLNRDGEAWGQAACYHRTPRHLSSERRNIARLFASIMSQRIEIAELKSARS